MMKQTILLLALAAPIIKADVNHDFQARCPGRPRCAAAVERRGATPARPNPQLRRRQAAAEARAADAEAADA